MRSYSGVSVKIRTYKGTRFGLITGLNLFIKNVISEMVSERQR